MLCSVHLFFKEWQLSFQEWSVVFKEWTFQMLQREVNMNLNHIMLTINIIITLNCGYCAFCKDNAYAQQVSLPQVGELLV